MQVSSIVAKIIFILLLCFITPSQGAKRKYGHKSKKHSKAKSEPIVIDTSILTEQNKKTTLDDDYGSTVENCCTQQKILQDEVDSLRKHVEQVDAEKLELRQQLEEARAESGKNVEQLLEVQQSKERLQHELDELKVKTEQLQSSLTQERERNAKEQEIVAQPVVEEQTVSDCLSKEEEKALRSELEAHKSALAQSQLKEKQTSNIVKLVKEGSLEMERQLNECQRSLDQSRSSMLKTEIYLKGNRTAFALERDQLSHRREVAELELSRAKDDLKHHLDSAVQNPEDDPETLHKSLKDCERKREEDKEDISQLNAWKSQNTKLKNLGNKLLSAKHELETLLKDCDADLENTNRLLELERKIGEEHLAQTKITAETATTPPTQVVEQTEMQQENCDTYKNQLSELQTKVSQLETSVSDNSGCEEMKQELDEKKVEVETLEAENTECSHSRQELEENKQDLVVKTDDLNREIQKTVEEKSKVEQSLEISQKRAELLQQEIDEIQGNVKDLSEKEKLANQEKRKMELLYLEYKEKVDDPSLFDVVVKKANWLKNPHLDGLDAAYNKAKVYLGPGISKSEFAFIEMQALVRSGSEKLSGAVGKKEYSSAIGMMLTFGICSVPLVISLCCIIRLHNRFSIEKVTIWMTLYNAIFCGFLFGLHVYLKKEPMEMLQAYNHATFEFMQFALAGAYSLYLFFVIMTTARQLIRLRCSITLRLMLQVIIPIAVAANFYVVEWKPAMFDSNPKIEDTLWGLYGLAFVVELILVSIGRDRSQPAPVQSFTPEKEKQSDDEQSNADTTEDTTTNRSIAQFSATSATTKQRKSGDVKVKKKKKKKGSKKEKTTENENSVVLEMLDPIDVATDTIASAGRLLSKKKKKSKNTEKVAVLDGDVESQKMD